MFLALTALYEKSSQPQNSLYLVQQFYGATRDFRLLAGLADAVVGQTAGKVYPFLQGMNGVLSEVRDEATADSIIEQLAKVRHRAKTPVDQRALDLLELLVERRAAELQNQPGPHVDRTLTAMQRAWKREWSPGEPRLVADLLASLGAISQPKLAQEQVRELESLHRDAAKGSIDRLHIAHRLASTHWGYSRNNAAIDLLTAALDEFQDASGGVLPVTANDPLVDAGLLPASQPAFCPRREAAVRTTQASGQSGANLLANATTLQPLSCALVNDGEVSLGRGAELYRAVEQELIADLLGVHDQNHRQALLSQLCGIYGTAHNKKLPNVADDLRKFAFKQLPEVLKRQTNGYEGMVSQTASTLHDIAGARDGLEFLIERIETEPSWFRYNNQDGWNRHAYQLGQWRAEAKELGELDGRLLRIVLKELRRDLQSRQSRYRVIYEVHNGYWKEKENDFARVADEVAAANKQSGAAAVYIAQYLYHCLNHYDRAIAILLDAHDRKVLDEGGQATLVDFLQRQNRYAESIPILEPLVERRPENLNYRILLMRAYFKTKQQEKLLALLKKTDTYFHQENRWQEHVMAALGRSCLENELYQQSVDYFNEAISLHQRTQPGRGIGNGVLSSYYASQARAYAGLGKTAEAVDAACGAIVSWGPTHRNRANAIQSLKDVLQQAQDLNAYVVHLDRETAKTGQDKPIVRKALGQVFLEKQEFSRAVTQLRLASDLQPNDAETHQALLTCFDKQEDQQAAVEQLLRWRELARRDIRLYEDLGKRLQQLGQPKEVERAYTSIVEVLPTESESHTLLAEIRQRQNRWDEAIVQWEQVARIRSLEPTGLVQLATALIREHRWDEAAAAITKLKARQWPPRFGDVPKQVKDLEEQMQKK